MVSTVTEPLPLAVKRYQTDLARRLEPAPPVAHAPGGAGSLVSTVAAELSTVLVKLLEETSVALAKLSLAGAGARTLTVPKLVEVPPPGGGLKTVRMLTPPKASRELETPAVS